MKRKFALFTYDSKKLKVEQVQKAVNVIAFYGPRIQVTKLAVLRRPGAGGSFIYGVIFSLGTSAAPLLLLLSVSAATANPFYRFILALCFGIGRGLPFLVVCLFAGAVAKFEKITSLRRSIQIDSGLALLLVCYYYITVFIDLQTYVKKKPENLKGKH